MKSKVETCRTWILELDEREAAWLRAYVQNSHDMSQLNQNLERAEDSVMRKRIFNALSEPACSWQADKDNRSS